MALAGYSGSPLEKNWDLKKALSSDFRATRLLLFTFPQFARQFGFHPGHPYIKKLYPCIFH
jgi:hypothetical protein